MDASKLRFLVTVVYADGARTALMTEARSEADARQLIVGRLAEECIEWPPRFRPEELLVVSEHRSQNNADGCAILRANAEHLGGLRLTASTAAKGE